MSICTRCGGQFGCAMRDGGGDPCWCTQLPPVVPVPEFQTGCWCPACLKQHMAEELGSSKQVPTPPLN